MSQSRIFLSSSIVAIAAVIGAAMPAASQVQGFPRASPAATSMQRVGISDITISYHRPAVNGREIWGGLVPLGAVWRAGANDNTTITFSHPVKVEGKVLAAGTYGLHMWPTDSDWQVIFSKNSTSWGSFTYDDKEDALRVAVKPKEAPFEEWLRYGFEDLSNSSAVVTMNWEKLEVPFKVEVDTKNLVLAKLRNEDLRSIPQFTWWGWRDAANYSLQNDGDLDEALGWIERSLGIEKNFSNQMVQAGILDKQGHAAKAKEIRDQAMETATEAQVNILGYQALGAGDTAGALVIFKKNIADYPDSWNTYDSLAEAYAGSGETALAVEYYTKALNMVEDAVQKQRIEAILGGLKAKP